ncbi:MAG: hypothetical protein ABI389_08055 [Rhodanobacter sp.]
MHNVFSTVVPGIQINDVVTEDFHNRYWIDGESTKGVVVGTSLNGIGKKIAMIDHARSADSREIVRLALASCSQFRREPESPNVSQLDRMEFIFRASKSAPQMQVLGRQASVHRSTVADRPRAAGRDLRKAAE